MLDVLRSQLLALRAQVDATLAVIDGVQPVEAVNETPICPHSETVNVGTFGAPEYKCMTCQATVAAPG